MSQKIIRGLLVMGCKEVLAYPGGKYREFTSTVKDRDGNDLFFFVGKSGALHTGRCASKSMALPDSRKQRVIAAGCKQSSLIAVAPAAMQAKAESNRSRTEEQLEWAREVYDYVNLVFDSVTDRDEILFGIEKIGTPRSWSIHRAVAMVRQSAGYSSFRDVPNDKQSA
jgi:hypothetical protein